MGKQAQKDRGAVSQGTTTAPKKGDEQTPRNEFLVNGKTLDEFLATADHGKIINAANSEFQRDKALNTYLNGQLKLKSNFKDAEIKKVLGYAKANGGMLNYDAKMRLLSSIADIKDADIKRNVDMAAEKVETFGLTEEQQTKVEARKVEHAALYEQYRTRAKAIITMMRERETELHKRVA